MQLRFDRTLDIDPWRLLLFNLIQNGIKKKFQFESNGRWNTVGTVPHWSHQKEPKQAKRKDEVIRRNLERIHISAAALLPSNPPRHSQASLIPKKKTTKNNKQKKEPRSKNLIILAARPCIQSGWNLKHVSPITTKSWLWSFTSID